MLVTVSYSLANGTDTTDDNGTTTEIPEVAGNLTSVPPELGPLLKLRWPLKGTYCDFKGNFIPDNLIMTFLSVALVNK